MSNNEEKTVGRRRILNICIYFEASELTINSHYGARKSDRDEHMCERWNRRALATTLRQQQQQSTKERI